MRRKPSPPLVWWIGAHESAIEFGRRVVPWGFDAVPVGLPGSHVWDGFDHVLRAGEFIATRRAWGRGTEPVTPLSEVCRWAPVPGIDDTKPATWAPVPGLDG